MDKKQSIKGKLTYKFGEPIDRSEVESLNRMGFVLSTDRANGTKAALDLKPVLDANGYVSIPQDVVKKLRATNAGMLRQARGATRILYFTLDERGPLTAINFSRDFLAMVDESGAELSVEFLSV